MDDKIIVSNKTALVKKYRRNGLSAIQKSLNALIQADRKRGIKSRVLYLDDRAAIRRVGGKAVANPLDPRENKAAIDAIFKKLRPDYLMILGAIDVVPHQDLKNPLPKEGDDDPAAFGDLPYACDHPYSRDIARFVGPTRVVGRLPDLVRAKEPSYIISLLNEAAAYTQRPPQYYERYFGLSAEVWQGSTRLSLNNIFGTAKGLHLSPTAGPSYPGGELGATIHFINCHGAPAAPQFMGQHGASHSRPVSLSTQALGGQVAKGTVVAAECCFGAQLYDSITLGMDMPICQSYLAQGAYGFLGSTTIAYGPEDENAQADLICQYFLLSVLEGASTGRATLVARQQFVQNSAQMDPMDLKTLAQFCLYGDPSIHPVKMPTPTAVPGSTPVSDAMRFFRAERRAAMKAVGDFLQNTKPTASKVAKGVRLAAPVKSALTGIAELAGLTPTQAFTPFSVLGAGRAASPAGKAATAPSRYHVTVGKPDHAAAEDKVQLGVAIVAKEVAGRIVGYRIYHRR